MPTAGSVAAGCFYTVVLNHDGRLFASGFNVNGVLAQGTRRSERRFLSILSKRAFTNLDGGLQHWLAIDEHGKLWACGNNHYGQLGLKQAETLRLRLVPALGGQRVASIACGLGHSLVCTAGGLLFAAGCNGDGQLGTGDLTSRCRFARVKDRVSLAPGSLAAGAWHSACVDSEGRVSVWGSAIGTHPVFEHPIWLRARICIPFTLDPRLFGGKVLIVAAGHCHAVAVTPSAVFSWGDDIQGCLGHGEFENIPLPKAIAAFQGCEVSSVACGPYHNVALDSSGAAFVWGDNRKGQLGLGDLDSRFMPVRLGATLVDNNALMQVSAGTEHCAAVTQGGLLYTWGRCQAGGSRRIPCGLGVVHRHRFATLPCRVTALFDQSHSATTACLGRWHGIGTLNALAWLMGTLPRAADRPGRRRSRRIAESRICWVPALPPDVVKVVLDLCRGANGEF